MNIKNLNNFHKNEKSKELFCAECQRPAWRLSFIIKHNAHWSNLDPVGLCWSVWIVCPFGRSVRRRRSVEWSATLVGLLVAWLAGWLLGCALVIASVISSMAFYWLAGAFLVFFQAKRSYTRTSCQLRMSIVIRAASTYALPIMVLVSPHPARSCCTSYVSIQPYPVGISLCMSARVCVCVCLCKCQYSPAWGKRETN